MIMGFFQFGSLPHALATRNMEPLAKAVLPALRRDWLMAIRSVRPRG